MSNLPAKAERQEAAIDRLLKDISRHARVRRRISGRYNNLQLFSDIESPDGETCSRSRRAWSDTPDVQLLLERERRYVAMQFDLVSARSAVNDAELDPKERVDAFMALSRYEAQATKELEAMNAALVAMRKDDGQNAQVIAGIAAKMADMAQKWRMHEDRNGGGMDNLTDADLA